MTTAWAAGSVGWGQARWRLRLTPKLLILRFTTRGNARSRRVGSSRSAISAMTRASVLAGAQGGMAAWPVLATWRRTIRRLRMKETRSGST
jgi:hypothetical protein